MLEVKGLSCLRNEQAIFSKLNFSAVSGTVLQICAGNGVGKTSLLKIIAGLISPSSGQVLWQKTDIRNNYPEFCSELSFVSHQHNLHPLLTAAQNLQLLCNLNSTQLISKTQILEALEFMCVGHKANIQCAEISAGQAQRVSLARLYISTARLWLLDEPFTNLDEQAKEILLQLCARQLLAGGIIIVATHHEFLLNNVAQQVLFLEDYVS